jgi:hypothetical protein
VRRFGLLLKDLGASELNWRLVRQANDLMKAGAADVTLFTEETLPPLIQPAGAAMQAAEAWGYRWPVCATTLSTAKKLAGLPGPAAKLFYVWDLEWLRFADRPFHALRAVYADERLALVTRTDEHRAVVEDLWCRPVAAVVPDADLAGLMGVAGC